MISYVLGIAKKLGERLASAPQQEGFFVGSKSFVKMENLAYFHIQPFIENEQGVEYRKNLLKNCKTFKGYIQCIIQGNKNTIAMYVGIPKIYKEYFINMFYSVFETSALNEVEKISIQPGKVTYLALQANALVADVASYKTSEVYMDPLKDLFGCYHLIPDNAELTVVYTIKMTKTWWEKVMDIFFGKGKQEKKQKSTDEKERDKTREKEAKKEDIYEQETLQRSIGYHLSHPNDEQRKILSDHIFSFFHSFLLTGKFKRKTTPEWLNLHLDQLSNFFHLPTKDYFVKGLVYNPYRKLPYPTNLPSIATTTSLHTGGELTLLGTTDYRGDKVAFGITKEDKARHIYIVGKTGTGKSTLLSNLIKSDMEAGYGLCLLDPHGDLVETCLENVPEHRINDVILFDVSDEQFPIGFNLLQAKNTDEKHRIVSGVVSVFYKLFEHSRGPRLEYVLRNVLLSVIEYPNATLLHVLRMLTDKNFKEEVLQYVTDPMLMKFWTNEYAKRDQKQVNETIGPITNKVGQFLSSSIVRNILGQYHSKLTIREAMDTGKIILVNLSKGKIGEDNARMIGSLLVSKIQIDAMSRADTPMHRRKDFCLYIDEFQNFTTESFATILSEARKYRLSLIIANQYISQLDEATKNAIFGNVGTIISFTLGYDDAVVIKSQYKDMVSINDLISLPRFTAYIRLMINGQTSNPFSMKTMYLPPIERSEEKIQAIKNFTRMTYAVPKEELEKQMAAWYNKNFSAQEKIMERAFLESIGLTEAEIDTYQDPRVQKHLEMYKKYNPDAIIFDLENNEHVLVFKNLPSETIDKPFRVIKTEEMIAQVYNQEYADHKRRKLLRNVEKLKQTMQQTPSKQDQELQKSQEASREKGGYETTSNTQKAHAKNNLHPKQTVAKQHSLEQSKQTTNLQNLQLKTSNGKSETRTTNKQQENNKIPIQTQNLLVGEKNTKTGEKQANEKHQQSTQFSINDIILGETYEGYVKLKYNYGLFITVKGVEGLCHKSNIVTPAGFDSWKKAYNIGDKVRVKAESFVDIQGEKRVVWTMK